MRAGFYLLRSIPAAVGLLSSLRRSFFSNNKLEGCGNLPLREISSFPEYERLDAELHVKVSKTALLDLGVTMSLAKSVTAGNMQLGH
eukprot:6374659-Amphidinium_carterae.2